MSNLASVDCFMCQASGYAPPGVSAGPDGACMECYPYRARGYPPGQKPRDHRADDPPTDHERRRRAMAQAVYDEQTFSMDRHLTRPRRKTRHRGSWPEFPRIISNMPQQHRVHYHPVLRAIWRPGDPVRRSPFGAYTRQALQDLPPADISQWLKRHREVRDLRHQAKALELRLAREDHDRALREAQQAKYISYGLYILFAFILVLGIVVINHYANNH